MENRGQRSQSQYEHHTVHIPSIHEKDKPVQEQQYSCTLSNLAHKGSVTQCLILERTKVFFFIFDGLSVSSAHPQCFYPHPASHLLGFQL